MTNNGKQPTDIREIKPEQTQIIKSDDQSAVIIEPQKLDVKKGGNIIIGTLNIFATPVKNRWQKHYHPKNKNWHIHLIVDAILAIIILGLITVNIYILSYGEFGPTSKVEITITTNSELIISGQKTSFVIDYKNGSKTKLTDASLTVNLPEHFIINEVSPQTIFTNHSNTFSLGDLNSGSNGEITITGVVLGQTDQAQNIDASLSFKLENSNRRQSKPTSYQYVIAGSNLSLAIEMPSQVSNGQTFNGQIKYQNNSSIDIAKLIINYSANGNNFQLTDSSQIIKDNSWTIIDLKAGTDGQINFSGKFINSPDESDASIEYMMAIGLGNNELIQQKITKEITIAHSKFNLEITGQNNNIDSDKDSQYNISYLNQENFTLQNVTISAKFDSNLVDNNIITWTKADLPELANIAPGQTGAISFPIKIKSTISQLTETDKNFTLQAVAEATYQTADGTNNKFYSFSDRLIQKLNTDLNLKAFGRYYTQEGDQLGIGPTPPIVGQVTKYWIFFNLENKYNDVSDVMVSARLPENISFTGKTSTTEDQPPIFNANNRQISWQINTVTAPSEFFSSIGATFEIELIPQNTDIGKTVDLITNISITGNDVFTGYKIIKTVDNITTNLTNDTKENSGGVVQGQ
ncbi:MAG TPA: hypothetical protein VJB67_03290 [Patescibacteria group bacterium]|nr:hypothetical protein [Patescibacteria group bacterium]